MKSLLSIMTLLCFTASAHATLIDLGNTTLDDGTGLEWLDVNLTFNQSYNQILAGAGGWVGAGYRHATEAEVIALAVSEAFPAVAGANVMANADISNMISLLGPNAVGDVYGFTSTPDGVLQRLIRMGHSDIMPDFVFAALHTAPGNSFDFIGHYLVRQAAVPEPGSWLLLTIGLIGLGYMRRRTAVSA